MNVQFPGLVSLAVFGVLVLGGCGGGGGGGSDDPPRQEYNVRTDGLTGRWVDPNNDSTEYLLANNGTDIQMISCDDKLRTNVKLNWDGPETTESLSSTDGEIDITVVDDQHLDLSVDGSQPLSLKIEPSQDEFIINNPTSMQTDLSGHSCGVVSASGSGGSQKLIHAVIINDRIWVMDATFPEGITTGPHYDATGLEVIFRPLETLQNSEIDEDAESFERLPVEDPSMQINACSSSGVEGSFTLNDTSEDLVVTGTFKSKDVPGNVCSDEQTPDFGDDSDIVVDNTQLPDPVNPVCQGEVAARKEGTLTGIWRMDPLTEAALRSLVNALLGQIPIDFSQFQDAIDSFLLAFGTADFMVIEGEPAEDGSTPVTFIMCQASIPGAPPNDSRYFTLTRKGNEFTEGALPDGSGGEFDVANVLTISDDNNTITLNAAAFGGGDIENLPDGLNLASIKFRRRTERFRDGVCLQADEMENAYPTDKLSCVGLVNGSQGRNQIAINARANGKPFTLLATYNGRVTEGTHWLGDGKLHDVKVRFVAQGKDVFKQATGARLTIDRINDYSVFWGIRSIPGEFAVQLSDEAGGNIIQGTFDSWRYQ